MQSVTAILLVNHSELHVLHANVYTAGENKFNQNAGHVSGWSRVYRHHSESIAPTILYVNISNPKYLYIRSAVWSIIRILNCLGSELRVRLGVSVSGERNTFVGLHKSPSGGCVRILTIHTANRVHSIVDRQI